MYTRALIVLLEGYPYVTYGSIYLSIFIVALLFLIKTAYPILFSLNKFKIFLYFGATLDKPLILIAKKNYGSYSIKNSFLAKASLLTLINFYYFS